MSKKFDVIFEDFYDLNTEDKGKAMYYFRLFRCLIISVCILSEWYIVGNAPYYNLNDFYNLISLIFAIANIVLIVVSFKSEKATKCLTIIISLCMVCYNLLTGIVINPDGFTIHATMILGLAFMLFYPFMILLVNYMANKLNKIFIEDQKK
jgi:hypothetical protein